MIFVNLENFLEQFQQLHFVKGSRQKLEVYIFNLNNTTADKFFKQQRFSVYCDNEIAKYWVFIDMLNLDVEYYL